MISIEPGAVIAGAYRLERPLARGGMGSVWVARHLRLDVEVAIKFMAPEYAASAEARARFEREAKASAQLRSPHVVQVHDYGVDGDTPYIVMELLEGEDLDARLRRVRRLSLAETWLVVDKVGRALSRAHEIGLVHRDLKPGNVFLARVGAEETVKILDFGIAKSMDPGLVGKGTKTGTLLGSPFYMSPEQMRRSKLVDHRSDLWAIGVIVYQCLVGRLPFSGEELVDILVEVCTEPIPPPSHFAPDLPPALDRFMERALCRDVSQRFQSANELVDALAAVGREAQAEGPRPVIGAAPSLPDASPPAHADPASPPAQPVASPPTHPHPPYSPAQPVPFPPTHPHPPTAPVGASTPFPSSTLAPAGHTFASPPGQGRRIRLMLGVVSVAAVAGVALSLLIFRAPSPAQRSGVASGEPSPSSEAPPVVETSAPSPAPTPASSAVEPAHAPAGSPHVGSASKPPVEGVSMGAPPPSPRAEGSPRPPAVKGSPKKTTQDPLDSR